MKRHIRIETPQGTLEREIDIPEGTMRLADLAHCVLELSSDFSGILERSAIERGVPASCRKGCGVCCRQLVTISPAEAWMIEELIETLPEPWQTEVLRRFAEIERRLKESGLLERMLQINDPRLTDEDHYALAQDYFRLGLPCPFQEQGDCGIYPNRPSICREYLVSSPPEHCADPFNQSIDRLPNSAQIGEALTGLCAQLLNTELEKIPLVLAPAWARHHSAGRIREWDSRGLLNRFLMHLEVTIGIDRQE